jgi:uncharacterized lipoprotein
MSKLRYIFSLLLCLCLTGCAPMVFLGGAAAGVGGYKYYVDVLTVVYEASFDKTWDASVKALEEMGFAIKDKTEKLGSNKISTKEDKNNKEVNISVNYISAGETEVTIRVGLLGDKRAANVINDKISSLLFKK